MAIRPTALWREAIEDEARMEAAGELEYEYPIMPKLYPQDLLVRMDQIFDTFEREVDAFHAPSDDEVLAGVRRVVLALNSLNEEYDGDAIATEGRDLLCAYIDKVLTEAEVDLDELSRRQGICRSDLTDEWRTW